MCKSLHSASRITPYVTCLDQIYWRVLPLRHSHTYEKACGPLVRSAILASQSNKVTAKRLRAPVHLRVHITPR